MPSPKSGTACTLVAPAEPDEALDADKADPGEVEKIKAEQQQLGKGKYGKQPVKPFKAGQGSGAGDNQSDDASDKKKTHWVEIELKTDSGDPVTGEPYIITLPDGTVAAGTLDEKGLARIEGLPDAGSCQATFPKRDKTAWKPA
jgi:hypothetical protein